MCNQYHHRCYDVKVNTGGFIKLPRLPHKIMKKAVNVVAKPVNNLVNWVEKWLRRALVLWVIISILYVVYIIVFPEQETLTYETEAQVIDTTPEKIEELKYRTIQSLAEKCETKDVKEPEAAIILDSNNQMSIGKYMWQIKSVQHYAKELYGKDISRKEAILIALGEGEIDLEELTMKVMFDVKNGWNEWHNCAKKLGLQREVEIINSL